MKIFNLAITHLIAALALSFVTQLTIAAEIPYLLTAASKGDLVTVKAMLNGGASANAKDENDITALMYAARKDQAAVEIGRASCRERV